MSVKSVIQVGFDEIFHFAEEYGISWNECNDLFFNGVLDYQSITDYYIDDWLGFVSFYETAKDKASDYSVEEVKNMDKTDKCYVIINSFFEKQGITKGEVQIDCR